MLFYYFVVISLYIFFYIASTLWQQTDTFIRFVTQHWTTKQANLSF